MQRRTGPLIVIGLGAALQPLDTSVNVAFTEAAVSRKEARGEMSAEDQKKVLERLRSLG